MPWDLNLSALDLDLVQRIPDHRIRHITKGDLSMDEAAFRAFYEETSRPLFAYLLRVLGERALAEDLLQDSYCRFLSAKLSPMDKSRRRSYLFRIATNLLRDRWRRHREDSLPDLAPEVASPAPHPDLRIQMRHRRPHLHRPEFLVHAAERLARRARRSSPATPAQQSLLL